MIDNKNETPLRKEEDIKEWQNTFDMMLFDDEEIVQSDFTFGAFITVKKELFDKMVDEINTHRLNSVDKDGELELIVVSEKIDNENK